jgi:hypothetical protein
MASKYQALSHQPVPVSRMDLLIISVLKDSNESLLLNLTKKMEELAVNIAKDKERRPKHTNSRPNIWCSNCKSQGHMAIECPSPPQINIYCTYYGGKHLTVNCWNWRKQQQMGQ